MSRWNKTLVSVTLLATVLGTAGVAMARGHGGEEGGRCASGPQSMAEGQATGMARHLDGMKQALKLTPAQEGAWKRFSESMSVAHAAPQRPEHGPSMTLLQRAEWRQARMQQRFEQMQQQTQALKALYAQLSPEQQKTLDQMPMQHPKMGRHGGQGRHGHHDQHDREDMHQHH